MRFTQEQYDQLQARRTGKPGVACNAPEKPDGPSDLIVAEKPSKPKRRMNKTEAAYGLILEARLRDGEIVDYAFESLRIRVADDAWYWPDYHAVLPDGGIEIHEVKGYMRDDARLKLHVAASLYPYWTFYLIFKRYVKDGGGFTKERIHP